jgi:hypothetical protein
MTTDNRFLRRPTPIPAAWRAAISAHDARLREARRKEFAAPMFDEPTPVITGGSRRPSTIKE